MKKLLRIYKDKLYTFLVLKNSAISAEYQSYVLADTERHAKHRIKSWIYLLKLNWKYRVRKLKLENKSIRKPYVGSESSISNRPLPIHLAMRLMKYDVISFDIFDTLILRPFNNPTFVFSLISEKKLWLKFREHRIKAEKIARDKALKELGTREINIFDIYHELNRETGIDIDEGIHTEYEIEEQICYANPYMLEVYKLLIAQGKKVICTSDMYWPKEYIIKLLEKCGYSEYDDVFVSCEYRVSKAEGILFDIVKETYGKHLSYIHIGDNYNTDILGAVKANIDNYFYKGVNAIGNSYRTSTISPLYLSAYCGLVNAKLHQDDKSFSPQYEFGYIYGGYYIFGFINYILDYCKQNSIHKILFIARDGYIYKQSCNLLDKNMATEYVLWSRICNIIYGIEFDRNFFLTRVCRSQINKKLSLEDILDSFDLSFLKIKINKYILKKELTTNNLDFFENFLIENINDIKEHYEESIDSLKEYFKYLIGNARNILLVDIGWMGTAPINIKKLIEDVWKLDVKVHILLAAQHAYTGDGGVNTHITSYLFNNQKGMYNRNIHKAKHTAIFELFTQSCSPSFAKLQLNGNNTKFIFQYPDIENYKATKEIQKGIIDFINDYRDKFKNFTFLYNISGQDAYIPFRWLMSNRETINIAIGNSIQQIYLVGINSKNLTGYNKLKNM